MPSNFVFKLIMTNNIFNTCVILSISTYETTHFWCFELNWQLQVKNLARQGLSYSSAWQGLSYPTHNKFHTKTGICLIHVLIRCIFVSVSNPLFHHFSYKSLDFHLRLFCPEVGQLFLHFFNL